MTATGRSHEPALSLPAGPMLGAALIVPIALGAAWWLAGQLAGAPGAALAGLAGASVTALCAGAGVLVIAPWKARPAGLWVTFWMAGTVVRLLLAIAMTFLLYSATPLSPVPLGVSVGVTYLLTLLAEAGLLTRHVNRTLAP